MENVLCIHRVHVHPQCGALSLSRGAWKLVLSGPLQFGRIRIVHLPDVRNSLLYNHGRLWRFAGRPLESHQLQNHGFPNEVRNIPNWKGFANRLVCRYVRQPWLKVIEACVVAGVTATFGILMMFLINDCRPRGQDPTKYPTQVRQNKK